MTETPKQKALRLAAELGVEIDYGGEGVHFEILVDAPEGYHWEGVVHQLVASIWDDDTTTDLWKDVAARMQGGVEPCGPDCEYWG